MEAFSKYFEGEELEKEEKYWLRCVNLDKELEIVNFKLRAQLEFSKAQKIRISDLENQIKNKEKEFENLKESRLRMTKSEKKDQTIIVLNNHIKSLSDKNSQLKKEIAKIERDINFLIFKANK